MTKPDLGSRRYPRDKGSTPRYKTGESQDNDINNRDDDDELSTRSLVRADRRTRLRTLESLDGRTRAARLARRLVEELVADLGGSENLSAAQQLLVQRAAILGAIIEDAETRWLDGKQIDLSLLGTLSDRLRRLLESLGLERQPKFVNATARAIQIIRGGERA